MDLHDGDEGGVKVVGFRFFGIENFDRVGSAGDCEDGTAEEVFGELFGIEGSGGDNKFEVGTSFEGLYNRTSAYHSSKPEIDPPSLTFQQTEQHVGGNCTLVRLIENDDRVRAHVGID